MMDVAIGSIAEFRGHASIAVSAGFVANHCRIYVTPLNMCAFGKLS
jgi:hypothetical protein